MGKANQKFAFIKGAFIQRCSVNKLFFKISQNSQCQTQTLAMT